MNPMMRFLRAAVLIAIVSALAACAGGDSDTGGTGGPDDGGAGGAENVVALRDNAFDPSSLSVQPGEKVTFENEDPFAHRIVVGSEDLGQQQEGESRTWTAPEAGTYELRCTIHPSMRGRVTVGEGGSEGASPPADEAPGGGY